MSRSYELRKHYHCNKLNNCITDTAVRQWHTWPYTYIRAKCMHSNRLCSISHTSMNVPVKHHSTYTVYCGRQKIAGSISGTRQIILLHYQEQILNIRYTTTAKTAAINMRDHRQCNTNHALKNNSTHYISQTHHTWASLSLTAIRLLMPAPWALWMLKQFSHKRNINCFMKH